jgi:hypothetical protein
MDKDSTADLFKGQNRQLADDLLAIIADMRRYWPLTVRQAFYQAVSKRLLSNDQNEYRRVSRILTSLRRHDLLAWNAIEDRTRRTVDKRGRPNVGDYIESEMRLFMNPDLYGRCYIQNQAVYIEVATEKDALSKIMEDAVWMFCTRLNVVRGQVSSSMVNSMAERFDKAIMLGKKPILVYFGDLDPSGIAIPKALIRNMAEWHSVEVELVRAALNPEQIGRYDLPVSLDAAKEQDPNYKAWLKEYGPAQAPVELDALHPRDLTELVTTSLTALYDMSQVDAEKAKEAEERELLKRIKRSV